jgi:hypothetical protein
MKNTTPIVSGIFALFSCVLLWQLHAANTRLARQEKGALKNDIKPALASVANFDELSKSQLTATKGDLYEASLPEVRVSVLFGNPAPHSRETGSVAWIHNMNGSSADLTVDVTRPSSGASRSFSFVLAGGAEKKVGQNEGWAFLSGDMITVRRAGHKSLTSTMD